MCVRVNINNLVCLKTGKTLLNFQQELAKKQFPSLSNNWECSWYIWYLNLMILHHVSWRSPLKVSLNLLAPSLVTRPIETFNGYLGVAWIASFPLFSEWFILESSPTSNKERSEILNVALTPYSPSRSILQALSLIISMVWKGSSLRGINFDIFCSWNISFLYAPKLNLVFQTLLICVFY